MSSPDENTVKKIKIPSDDRLSAAEYRDYLDSVESSKSDGAYDPDLSAGLRLVIKGIEEDEKENYNEASRLFQEARKLLEPCIGRETRDNVKRVIRRKYNQLQNRKLLINVHLTLAKRPVRYSNYQSGLMTGCSAIHIGRNFTRKAIDEDDKGNYEEALRLFKESEKYFLRCLEHEAKTDRHKDMMRNYLKKLDAKAKSLEEILEKEKITRIMGQMSRL